MIWRAIILAAARGPADPMARAYGVTHKCLIEVGGVPMLQRVVDTLSGHPAIGDISVVIDDVAVGEMALGPHPDRIGFEPARESAARSLIALLDRPDAEYPVLVTTADHPLLTFDMVDRFLAASQHSGADLTVGLARAETILGAYPDAIRTFLAFGRDRVSGCNLFGLRSPRAVKAIKFWHYLEPLRKKPWRIFGAFGPGALLRYATGNLDLDSAFAIASRRIGLTARPVIMPFAEAAVDVDKPADKELAERILQMRAAHYQRATS